MWAATALPAASTLNNYCQHPAPQQQSALAVSTIDPELRDVTDTAD